MNYCVRLSNPSRQFLLFQSTKPLSSVCKKEQKVDETSLFQRGFYYKRAEANRRRRRRDECVTVSHKLTQGYQIKKISRDFFFQIKCTL